MPRRRSFSMQAEVDPLTVLMRPPRNESPSQKVEREAEEREAKRINERIETQLRADSAKMKKVNKTTVKVLLLGQGESGKSTTLKNFRLAYAPEAFAAEKSSWKAVIHLNLIRTVLRIMDEVKTELDFVTPPNTSGATSYPSQRSSVSRSSSRHNSTNPSAASTPLIPSVTFRNNASTRPDYFQTEPPQQQQDNALHDEIDVASLNILLLRLSPLRGVEKELKQQLGGGTEEVHAEEGAGYGVLGSSKVANSPAPRRKLVQEWAVRANPWRTDPNPDQPPRLSTSEVSAPLLSSLLDDLQDIWQSPSIRLILERRGVFREIEESPGGYYLNSLSRVISPSYSPSDQDVLRARLRTLGVQETKIWFGTSGTLVGRDFGREWILYDVGGSRTMRNAWVPFFDAVNAIIFLAPISCFDEYLAEDPRVNRLEDSIQLWRSVCSSKLISDKITFILFLNKCDILERKLNRGIRLKEYLPSFGDRDNSIKPATKYFRQKFKDIIVQSSQKTRVCYIYPTSVTDTTATRTTLETVRDGIIREHLKYADFM